MGFEITQRLELTIYKACIQNMKKIRRFVYNHLT